MKIRSKLFLSNLAVVLVAMSIGIFFVFQLPLIFIFLSFVVLFISILVSYSIALKIGESISSLRKMQAESEKKADEELRNFNKAYQAQRLAYELDRKKTLNILDQVKVEKSKTDALLTGIGEGVIATDVNKNVIFMNRSAEEIIGWNASEVMGKNLDSFLKVVDEKDKPIPENHRPFYLALKIGQKVISSVEKNYFYINKSGEKFPVSISVTPVMMNNKLMGAIDVFRDITHEKEIDKAKTEFVSLASHQLRTPLSAINWYTEMLLDGDAGKITKEQRQYLEEVYGSNKRMVELVNSLLDVSRIDLGTFAINPEMSDISKIAKSVLSELMPMIKTKKIKIEENYNKDLGDISVDQKLTRIIFQNLLSNAVKYTPEKGRVSVSIEKQDSDALIKVKDTGYGIPKKDQPRIFEKLFRADNIREKETDGTGLGLYVAKSVIEQAGGKIWFESAEDKGTTFYVTIPLAGMRVKEGTKILT